jgi:hypothetical protein
MKTQILLMEKTNKEAFVSYFSPKILMMSLGFLFTIQN